MKWKYDRNNQQWFNDNWLISKEPDSDRPYRLAQDRDYGGTRKIAWFRKLSTAKNVAELIEAG